MFREKERKREGEIIHMHTTKRAVQWAVIGMQHTDHSLSNDCICLHDPIRRLMSQRYKYCHVEMMKRERISAFIFKADH